MKKLNFETLTNPRLLDDLLFSKWLHTLRRVGRRNMSALELWKSWINE